METNMLKHRYDPVLRKLIEETMVSLGTTPPEEIADDHIFTINSAEDMQVAFLDSGTGVLDMIVEINPALPKKSASILYELLCKIQPPVCLTIDSSTNIMVASICHHYAGLNTTSIIDLVRRLVGAAITTRRFFSTCAVKRKNIRRSANRRCKPASNWTKCGVAE
jgi:hypothetical protein